MLLNILVTLYDFKSEILKKSLIILKFQTINYISGQAQMF